jgi:hypothetical protein
MSIITIFLSIHKTVENCFIQLSKEQVKRHTFGIGTDLAKREFNLRGPKVEKANRHLKLCQIMWSSVAFSHSKTHKFHRLQPTNRQP